MITAIASSKGGTSKTSTAISLSAGLAKLGKRVLVCDLDSQADLSKVFIKDYLNLKKEQTIYTTILDRKPLPIHKTTLANLDVVPSHILLSSADMALATVRDHREQRLRDQLDKVASDYDHVILDLPPSLGWQSLNGLTASDNVLVTVSPGYFELNSILLLFQTTTEVKNFFNPDIELLGILFSMSDPTINSRSSLKLLRQTYPDDVCRTIIPRNVAMRDSQLHKTNIFDYAPNSKSALAYKKLIQELYFD